MFTTLVKHAVNESLKADILPWKLMRSIRNGTIVLGYHGIALDEEIRNPWIQRVQTPISEFRTQLEFIGKNFEVISADETLKVNPKRRRIHLTFDDGYSGFAEHAVPLLKEYGFTASVYIVTQAATDSSRLPPYIGRAAISHCEPGLISLESLECKLEISDSKSRLSAYRRFAPVLKSGNQQIVHSLTEELINLIPAEQWDEINYRYASDELMGWDSIRKVADAGFTVGAHTQTHLSLSDRQDNDVINSEG